MTFSGSTKMVSKSFHLNSGTADDHLKMKQNPYLIWLAIRYERSNYYSCQSGTREANNRKPLYSHLLG